MNKTDLMEIKKLFKYPDASFDAMFCGTVNSKESDEQKGSERVDFVNAGKYLTRDEEEQKAFMSLLPKAFSGASNMSPADVTVEGDMRKLLSSYLDSNVSLPFDVLVGQIANAYDEINSYSVIAFRGSYDIPVKDSAKIKTGESEEVYTYLVLMICPVKAIKGGLSPDADTKNIVKKGATLQLQPPTFGLIYPSFTDRTSDPEHAFVCSKGDNERKLITRMFGADTVDISKEDIKPKSKAKTKSVSAFSKEIESLGREDEIPSNIIESVKTGDAKALAESIKEYAVNNIDDVLLGKRKSVSTDSDDIEQKIEIKKDMSEVAIDHIVERDINGRKYFLIPKEILDNELLEKITQLENSLS